MKEPTTNISIKSADQDSIVLEVNGQTQQILNRLDAMQQLLEKLQVQTFQTADKIYNIKSINQASFEVVLDRIKGEQVLPQGLAENLIGTDNIWIQSLKEELQSQANISVGNNPGRIFHHYGWLIETFLLKIASKAGLDDPLRRLSFMTEAYQSSLRYLSYIQLAQVLSKTGSPAASDFFEVQTEEYGRFDFLNLLLQVSAQIPEEDYFISEMIDFMDLLSDKESELYETVIFLEQQRSALITNSIPSDRDMDRLLEEYLTALVYWLRHLSFLAQYRLVSIKDVNLRYQLGTPKYFIHTYGELHGVYDQSASDFITYTTEDVFTYSSSVLLFKGANVVAGMEKIAEQSNYLSLSPLIIDQSVYTKKETQTPEIYYYIGKGRRYYRFARYQNELSLHEQEERKSNKFLNIKNQNTDHPKLNHLYKQLDEVFRPFKAPRT